MPASGESHCLYGRRSLGRRQRDEHERDRESRGSKRLSRQQYFGRLEARRSRALSDRRNPGAIPAQTSARDTKNTRCAVRICEDRLPDPPLTSLFRFLIFFGFVHGVSTGPGITLFTICPLAQ